MSSCGQSAPYVAISSASVVAYDADSEQSPSQWYAIHTRPRHEKTVVAELTQKGITTYLPLLTQIHHWSDRRKLVQVPLFSCYVFIQAVLTPEVRGSVLRVWGALGFVGPNREAREIPASQIDDVRRLLSCDKSIVANPLLKIGKRVRIRGGCLDGMEGVLVGSRGNRSMVISVDSIEQSLSISVEGYDIVPIQ